MKKMIAAVALTAAMATTASAQQYAASDGYRVCAPSATELGIEAARETCGVLNAPNFSNVSISSESQLQSLAMKRDTFRSDVKAYGQCITTLINSYRRPGMPADSKVPDQAACAHSWAEDQSTEVVRQFGKACIDYSNRSVMDADLQDYTGSCYPSAGSGQG